MTETQYPKAGDVWTVGEHRAEWLKDMQFASPITNDCVLFDGKKGEPGDVIPGWFMQEMRRRGGSIMSSAEAAVTGGRGFH